MNKIIFFTTIFLATSCAHSGSDQRQPSSFYRAQSPVGRLFGGDGSFNNDKMGRFLLATCGDQKNSLALLGNHEEIPPEKKADQGDLKKAYGFDRIWTVDARGETTELNFIAPFTRGFPYGLWRGDTAEVEITFSDSPGAFEKGRNVVSLRAFSYGFPSSIRVPCHLEMNEGPSETPYSSMGE